MRGGGGGGNGEDGRGTQGLSYMIRFLQCPESEGLGRLWTVRHLCQVGLEAVSVHCALGGCQVVTPPPPCSSPGVFPGGLSFQRKGGEGSGAD